MAIEKKEYCLALFLDISQAFDKVWHHGLKQKIKETGLTGNLPNFLINFLTNRSIKVRVGTNISEPQPIKSGVPQGSVISPTLFTLFINDIFNKTASNIKSSLFADDGAMWTTNKDFGVARQNLQNALDEVNLWTQTWGLTLSQSKTTAMIFTNKRLCSHLPLTLNNLPITYSTTAKYLGMTFDSKLIWNHHINELIIRCKKDLKLLRIISCNKYSSDFITLKRLYTALIRPKLDYGCILLLNTAKTHLTKLDKIQQNALKISLGLLKCTSNFKVEIEANITPLSIRRKQLLLQYGLRTATIPNHPNYLFIKYETPLYLYVSEKFKLLTLHLLLKEINLILPTDCHSPPVIHMENRYNTATFPINSTLATVTKDFYTSSQWKTLYNDLIDSKYTDHTLVFTDGSRTIDNCGSGVWSSEFQLVSKLPTRCNIFTAELYAIYSAVSFLKSMPGKFLILTDSLSSIRALQSLQVTSHYLLSWTKNALKQTTDANKIIIEWVPSHSEISGNDKADVIAKNSSKLTKINDIPYSSSDLRHAIQSAYIKVWQDQWENLGPTLTKFKPVIGPTAYGDHPRQYQLPLSRIRLGTTLLTHAHYFNKTNKTPKKCTNCDVTFTLNHLLIDCPILEPYRDEMKQYLKSKNL